MQILIVRESVSLHQLKEIAQEYYQTLIKGVADIERDIIAIGGEWHMDANNLLIADGSIQKDLWGFNILLEEPREEWIEYHSLINIRPAQGNKGMEIKDETLRQKIKTLIGKRVQ